MLYLVFHITIDLGSVLVGIHHTVKDAYAHALGPCLVGMMKDQAVEIKAVTLSERVNTNAMSLGTQVFFQAKDAAYWTREITR